MYVKSLPFAEAPTMPRKLSCKTDQTHRPTVMAKERPHVLGPLQVDGEPEPCAQIAGYQFS